MCGVTRDKGFLTHYVFRPIRRIMNTRGIGGECRMYGRGKTDIVIVGKPQGIHVHKIRGMF